jgi:hypothetical protein
MKRADKSTKVIRDLDHLLSELSDDEILSLQAMSFVRGGEGEGGGDIIIIPPPPGGGQP